MRPIQPRTSSPTPSSNSNSSGNESPPQSPQMRGRSCAISGRPAGAGSTSSTASNPTEKSSTSGTSGTPKKVALMPPTRKPHPTLPQNPVPHTQGPLDGSLYAVIEKPKTGSGTSSQSSSSLSRTGGLRRRDGSKQEGKSSSSPVDSRSRSSSTSSSSSSSKGKGGAGGAVVKFFKQAKAFMNRGKDGNQTGRKMDISGPIPGPISSPTSAPTGSSGALDPMNPDDLKKIMMMSISGPISAPNSGPSSSNSDPLGPNSDPLGPNSDSMTALKVMLTQKIEVPKVDFTKLKKVTVQEGEIHRHMWDPTQASSGDILAAVRAMAKAEAEAKAEKDKK